MPNFVKNSSAEVVAKPSNQRRVAVFTSTRADYGLLYWTMKELLGSEEFELQLIVSGTHLCTEFGTTVREIENDGFPILKRVEMLLSSDSCVGVAKSLALGVIGYTEALTDLKPGLLILLGDRYETLAAATAATLCRVPIAHLHGGETSEGANDEAFRHAITKMSHFHFVAAEAYRRRVIQLGECPSRVFLTGGFGLENIARAPLMDRESLCRELGWDLEGDYVVVTYHPVTLEAEDGTAQVVSLMEALSRFPELKVIVTLPNADAEGRAMRSLFEDYAQEHPERIRCYSTLGRLRYLSAVTHSCGVVGNSSSGIIEAPSLGVGTLDIGERQKGRLRSDSVLHCDPTSSDIEEGLQRLLSPEFRSRLPLENPYWRDSPSKTVLATLRSLDFGSVLKKTFHDLPSYTEEVAL